MLYRIIMVTWNINVMLLESDYGICLMKRYIFMDSMCGVSICMRKCILFHVTTNNELDVIEISIYYEYLLYRIIMVTWNINVMLLESDYGICLMKRYIFMDSMCGVSICMRKCILFHVTTNNELDVIEISIDYEYLLDRLIMVTWKVNVMLLESDWMKRYIFVCSICV